MRTKSAHTIKQPSTPTADDITRTLTEAETALRHVMEQLATLRARGTRENVPLVVEDPLYHQVRVLITERPMRFRELVEACKLEGAQGENRIKGIIVKLQRENMGVVNLGNQYKALWWIADAGSLERLRR